MKMLALVSMMVLMGCADNGEPAKVASGVTPSIASGDWQLTSITRDGETVQPSANITLKLDAEAKQVSGSAGCNRYSAGFTLTEGAFTIERAASTKRMCGKPEGVMDQESAFLGLLTNTHEVVSAKANELVLNCPAGKLTFSAVAESGSGKGPEAT